MSAPCVGDKPVDWVGPIFASDIGKDVEQLGLGCRFAEGCGESWRDQLRGRGRRSKEEERRGEESEHASNEAEASQCTSADESTSREFGPGGSGGWRAGIHLVRHRAVVVVVLSVKIDRQLSVR